jgi:hypothetical protein
VKIKINLVVTKVSGVDIDDEQAIKERVVEDIEGNLAAIYMENPDYDDEDEDDQAETEYNVVVEDSEIVE